MDERRTTNDERRADPADLRHSSLVLRQFTADLHLHTVLSPCAEVEMIPPLIIRQALAKAEEATKLGPDKSNGWALAAKMASPLKDWDKAITYAEKALALDPDATDLYPLLLTAYREKGDKVKAAEYEKKFASANPDDPDILYNQAVELYNKNDFKGAAPILAKAIEARPDYAKAHFLLGMSYVNLNKIPEMKKHLQEYLKLDPKGADAAVAKEMLDAFK